MCVPSCHGQIPQVPPRARYFPGAIDHLVIQTNWHSSPRSQRHADLASEVFGLLSQPTGTQRFPNFGMIVAEMREI